MTEYERLKVRYDALKAKQQTTAERGWKRECDDSDRIMTALCIEGDTRTEGGWLRVDKALGRIASLTSAVPPPASETGQASAWQPMESAPKDGTHILATNGRNEPTTVHWHMDGWYLSVNLMEAHADYAANWGAPTVWMALPPWYRKHGEQLGLSENLHVVPSLPLAPSEDETTTKR